LSIKLTNTIALPADSTIFEIKIEINLIVISTIELDLTISYILLDPSTLLVFSTLHPSSTTFKTSTGYNSLILTRYVLETDSNQIFIASYPITSGNSNS